MMPYESIGENGRQLTTWDRGTEECSSFLCKRDTMSCKKYPERSKKVWEILCNG